jgi:hypothetical protein
LTTIALIGPVIYITGLASNIIIDKMALKQEDQFRKFMAKNANPIYECFISTPNMKVQCTTCSKLLTFLKKRTLD